MGRAVLIGLLIIAALVAASPNTGKPSLEQEAAARARYTEACRQHLSARGSSNPWEHCEQVASYELSRNGKLSEWR